MRLPHIQTIASCLVTLLLATGCGKKSSEPEALAEVGSERITRQDLALELQRQAPKVGAEERQQAAMDSLLRRKRMVAAAREQGLADRPEVRRAMDSILIKVLMEQELQPRLDEVQVDESDVAGAYYSKQQQQQ